MPLTYKGSAATHQIPFTRSIQPCNKEKRGTIWVPTISTVGNLVDDDRYPHEVTKKIFDEHMGNVAKGAKMGVKIACGSDAGAYRVPHVQGALDEMNYLKEAIGENAEQIVMEGNDGIFKNFV